MPVVTMKELLEAGVHFGHQTRRWNPKMKPYIFTERNDIYIIDLQKTLIMIGTAFTAIRQAVSDGGTVLFVGTKKQAQEAVEEHSVRAGQPYVNNRWLGGTLTNFTTIHSRIMYLNELARRDAEGELDVLAKKEALQLRRQEAKLEKNLSGISNMHKLPAMVFVIDPRKERIAVAEQAAGDGLRDRSPQGEDRRGRGPQAGHTDRRDRRHQLRPGRGRLRDTGQRRRHPLGQPDVPDSRGRGDRR